MKVIRASRGIFVPINPEKPDINSVRLLQTGLIALIPDDFSLPKDSYVDLGKFNTQAKKKEKDQDI